MVLYDYGRSDFILGNRFRNDEVVVSVTLKSTRDSCVKGRVSSTSMVVSLRVPFIHEGLTDVRRRR